MRYAPPPHTVGHEGRSASRSGLSFDALVYPVIRAIFAGTAVRRRAMMEIIVDLVITMVGLGLGLDSFNHLSRPPGPETIVTGYRLAATLG